MLENSIFIVASFTHPMDISITPLSLLWILPLIAAISLIYKATKLRVIIWKKILRETIILFLTTTSFMCLLALVLWGIIEIIT